MIFFYIFPGWLAELNGEDVVAPKGFDLDFAPLKLNQRSKEKEERPERW